MEIYAYIKRNYVWTVCIIVLVMIPLGTYRVADEWRIPETYSFIPYDLAVRPGTNGDGTLSYTPAIVPNVTQPGNTRILTQPLPLDSASDLGWSGDLIVRWDKQHWETVAVVEDHPETPAILAARFGTGGVVYVTNPLTRFYKLVYNIFAWHLLHKMADNANATVRVAIMWNVPGWKNSDDWNNTFTNVMKVPEQSVTSQRSLQFRSISLFEIEQFQLRETDLREFDVLILGLRWGDGYYAKDWNWDSHQRDAAILQFVSSGGLLLLPEAGYFDEYGLTLPHEASELFVRFGVAASNNVIPIPIRALEDYLSSQPNSFAMAALSLSAIGILHSIRGEKRSDKDSKAEGGYFSILLKRRYTKIYLYLFCATFLWIVVPLLVGQLLLQTAVLLAAVLTDLVALVLLLVPHRAKLEEILQGAKSQLP